MRRIYHGKKSPEVNKKVKELLDKCNAKCLPVSGVQIREAAKEIANELNLKIIKLPFYLVKLVALLGDGLKVIGINFPMTSFRLHNMTTDNVMDLSNTKKTAPNLPYTRIQGIKNTLQWINIIFLKSMN